MMPVQDGNQKISKQRAYVLAFEKQICRTANFASTRVYLQVNLDYQVHVNLITCRHTLNFKVHLKSFGYF